MKMQKTCKRCGVKGEIQEVTQESTLKIISTDKVGMRKTFKKSTIKDVPTDEVGMRIALVKSGPNRYQEVWLCAKCAKEIEKGR